MKKYRVFGDVGYHLDLRYEPKKQVGGTHYSDKGIQPIDYIDANNLGFYEANIIKYITRYKDKNGLEDLKKAKWYLDRLIDNYIKKTDENYI